MRRGTQISKNLFACIAHHQSTTLLPPSSLVIIPVFLQATLMLFSHFCKLWFLWFNFADCILSERIGSKDVQIWRREIEDNFHKLTEICRWCMKVLLLSASWAILEISLRVGEILLNVAPRRVLLTFFLATYCILDKTSLNSRRRMGLKT